MDTFASRNCVFALTHQKGLKSWVSANTYGNTSRNCVALHTEVPEIIANAHGNASRNCVFALAHRSAYNHESAQTHSEMPLEIVCLRSHTEVSEVTGQRKYIWKYKCKHEIIH